MAKSNIEILSISKVVKIVKRPRVKNLHSGNVCIYPNELASVGLNDTVIIEVQDQDGEVVRSRTYKGKDFHSNLETREKRTKGGFNVKFTTIEC